MPQLQRLVIAPSQVSEQQVRLTTEQQHYLNRVLRLQVGDRFIAMDGKGWWLAVLRDDLTQAELLEPIVAHTELPIAVTLLIALPKNGMDDIVRHTTELGVSRILPVISQRTVLKPSPQKRDRWQRIAQEAAEQSERQIIPEVLSPQSWTEALSQWNAATSTCYLCEARGEHPHLLTCLMESGEWGVGSGRREGGVRLDVSELSAQPVQLPVVTIAIGTEGGWTEAEVNEAIVAGYQPVSLGARILRAVTAPVVAMSLVASSIEAIV
jgi:16S rRNA (uracil1498-N3)-methyltransferase